MTWTLVVRQSLRESHRGRELPLLLATFAMLFGAMGLLVGAANDVSSTADLLTIWGVVAALLLPVVGLMLGQPIVSSRREDGRLRLLFGMPISRRDFLAGSYLGAGIVYSTSLAVGVLVGVLASGALGVDLDVVRLIEFAGAAAGLGLAYLGLAVGVSAASRTTRWATFNMLGLYLALAFVWRLAPYVAVLVTNGFGFPETIPPWVDLLAGLSPSVAFERLLGFHGIEFFEATHYTSTEFGAGVLLLWILVPPLIGLWRFSSTDL